MPSGANRRPDRAVGGSANGSSPSSLAGRGVPLSRGVTWRVGCRAFRGERQAARTWPVEQSGAERAPPRLRSGAAIPSPDNVFPMTVHERPFRSVLSRISSPATCTSTGPARPSPSTNDHPVLHDHHEPTTRLHTDAWLRGAGHAVRQERGGRQPRVLAGARQCRFPRRERGGDRQPRGRVAAAQVTHVSTATRIYAETKVLDKEGGRRASPTAAIVTVETRGFQPARRRGLLLTFPTPGDGADGPHAAKPRERPYVSPE